MFDAVDISMFLATTDAQASLKFYTQALGLTLREDNPFALVFDLKGVELRIAKVRELAPMPFTVLDWQISDMSEAMNLLESRNVKFEFFEGMGMNERNVWSTPDGTQIAWFKDPDGNVLSISQRS